MHNTWCSRQWTLVVCHLHPLTSHASHAIDDQWTSTAPLLLYLLVDDTSYFPGLQSKLISRDWIALPILNAAKVKMLEERWSCNWLLIVRQPTLSHHRNACFSASFSFFFYSLAAETSPVFFYIYIMRTEFVQLHLSLTAGFPLGECAQLQSLQLPRKMQKTI